MNQLTMAYLIVAIMFLGFVLLAIFGKTEENNLPRRSRKTTTTTS